LKPRLGWCAGAILRDDHFCSYLILLVVLTLKENYSGTSETRQPLEQRHVVFLARPTRWSYWGSLQPKSLLLGLKQVVLLVRFISTEISITGIEASGLISEVHFNWNLLLLGLKQVVLLARLVFLLRWSLTRVPLYILHRLDAFWLTYIVSYATHTASLTAWILFYMYLSQKALGATGSRSKMFNLIRKFFQSNVNWSTWCNVHREIIRILYFQ
jgi:hypothetical protein